MAVNVPKGSIVTYTSSDWYSGYFTSAGDVVRAVGQKLIADGLTIRNTADISVNGVVGAIDKWLGGPATFTITMQVQVTGGTGYAKADDVASIINHEVYQVTGHLPGVWSVPDVTTPASAGTSVPGFLDWLTSIFTGKQATGQPAAPSSGGFFSGLTGNLILYVGLGIFGFVAALALIGYSGALKRT